MDINEMLCEGKSRFGPKHITWPAFSTVATSILQVSVLPGAVPGG